MSEKSPAATARHNAAPTPLPSAEQALRGLSVAAAARAATIAFRPLRPPPPPAPASAGALDPAAAADAQAVVTPARPPDPVPLQPPGEPAAALQPAQPVRRPGAQAQRQRFAKTIAALERHQEVSREREPGSDLVPRPTLPFTDRETSGPAWLRLWSRRKGGAAR